MITVLHVHIYMHKTVVIILGLIEDQVKEYIFEVDNLSAVVGVHVDGSSAVVGLEKGVLKCFSCCIPKACCHVVYMSLLLDDKEQLESTNCKVFTILSKDSSVSGLNIIVLSLLI